MLRKFQNKGQDFLTLSWSTHAGEVYYSVLVRPCGFVVLELISDTLDSELRSLAKPSNQRMFWKYWNNEHIAHGEYLTPIKVIITIFIQNTRIVSFRSAELLAVWTRSRNSILTFLAVLKSGTMNSKMESN